MIDHLNLPVRDFAGACAFYRPVMAALGLRPLAFTEGEVLGFGDAHWRFGLVKAATPCPPLHLAFAAESPEQVRAFHAAALAVGAQDNGAPDLRPTYGAGYYAGFVLDPEGHNLEAVHRGGADGS